MQSAVYLVAAALLAGGPPRATPAAGVALKPRLEPATRLEVAFDAREGRTLIGVQAVRPESEASPDGYRIVERGPAGDRLIAERGGAAAYAPDGAILFVREGELVELSGSGERVHVRGIEADFAVDPTGTWIAYVRAEPPGTRIELVHRNTARLRALVRGGSGWNGLPIFSADGQQVVFSSSRTGVASLFAVDLAGRAERQLTNVGVRALPSPRFVPPPNGRAGLRVDASGLLEYRAGGDAFRIDLASGAAKRVEVQR